MLDFYELLGVARSATQDEIKRAYRREISKYHPDRFVNAPADQQQYAELRSQRLTEAYATLSDVKTRTNYSRSYSAAAAQREPGQTPPTRDYQAELYEQATAYLQAGHTLQAIGVLRQLQQINPFYRDSADLLAQAEQQTRTRPVAVQPKSNRRPLLVVAGFGGIALVGAVAWVLGQRTPQVQSGQNGPSGSAALAITAPPAPTGAAQGLASTAVPSAAPSQRPSAAPTIAPTAAPTEQPTATSVPTEVPTSAPTALSVTLGQVLFSDDFSNGGWADTRGAGWAVGFSSERYRIAVDPGIGAIWSYRTLRLGDHSIASDVQVTRGEAGLLLGFVNANSYLSFTINPQQTSFRLEQRRGDFSDVLAGGQTDAINSGARAINRIEAQQIGDQVQLIINGRAVGNATLSDSPSGSRFGVVSISGATAAEGFFDNLEIREISR